jgi:hypothetical protein
MNESNKAKFRHTPDTSAEDKLDVIYEWFYLLSSTYSQFKNSENSEVWNNIS